MKRPVIILIIAAAGLYAMQIWTIVLATGKAPVTEIVYREPVQHMVCTVTAYTNRVSETNSDPGRTAILEAPKAGWTCAVSRDLMHWLGGKVYIEGIGVRRVNDLMNRRFTGSLDLYMGKVKDAVRFGKQRRQVVFLGRNI